MKPSSGVRKVEKLHIRNQDIRRNLNIPNIAGEIKKMAGK